MERTAIVYGVTTGSAATIVELATAGVRCALVGTDPVALEDAAALARAHGGIVETAVLDPADRAAVEDHLGALLRATGPLDISVHVTPVAAAIRAVAPHCAVVVLLDAPRHTRAHWARELGPLGVRLTGTTIEGATTVKFALVYAYDPTTASPAEGEVPDWIALDEEFRAAGIAVHEAGFHPRDEGRVVRVRDGAAEVSKEPAAPAANTVAGYYVVEAADIEAATELAAKIPTAKYGYVEVRQVVEF